MPHEMRSAGERATIRRELDTDLDATVIVQVSRLEPYKGHLLLLEALKLLARNSSWVCWVVGGPQTPRQINYIQRIKAEAERAGLAHRIRFVGERSDVGRLLGAADIFCQPNVQGEPFGIAFVEALYHGLPVVSTRIGGAIEIVDDSCGRLFAPCSAEPLANALLTLLRDESLRNKLGAAGPQRASTLCSPEISIDRLARLLESTINALPDASRMAPVA